MNEDVNYAKVIGTELFEVMVPYSLTLSRNQMRMETYDSSRLDNMVKGYYTIEQLTDFNKYGHPIEVCNQRDIIKIYKTIQGHIRVVNEYHDEVFVMKEYPEEDLKDLDELAKAIYSVNDDYIIDDVNKEFSKSAFFGGGSIMPGITKVDVKSNKDFKYTSRVKTDENTLANSNDDTHQSLKTDGMYDIDKIIGYK